MSLLSPEGRSRIDFKQNRAEKSAKLLTEPKNTKGRIMFHKSKYVLVILISSLASNLYPAESLTFHEEFEKKHQSIRWKSGAGEKKGGSSTVELTPEVGYNNSGGLVWKYNFEGVEPAGGIYARCRPDFELPGIPQKMTFKMLADKSNMKLIKRISDATGRTWQSSVCTLDTEGWQTIEIDLTSPKGFAWGGKQRADKQFEYPIKFVEFVISPIKSMPEETQKGKIVFDDLKIYSVLAPKDYLKMEMKIDEENNLTTNNLIRVNISHENISDKALSFNTDIVVTRLNGKKVSEQQAQLLINPKAKHDSFFDISLKQRGYYDLSYNIFDKDGKKINTIKTSIGRIANAGTEKVTNSVFGVCVHGASEKSMANIRRLGSTIVRGGIKATWNDLQPQQGVYSFTGADKQVQWAEDYGLMNLLLTGGNPKWLKLPEGQGTDLNLYSQHMAKVANHFKNRGYIYDIWNEPDLSSWKGTPAEFGIMSEQICAVIKKQDPTAKVLFGGTSGVDFHSGLNNFIFPALKAIDNRFPFDGLNVHPYCRPKSFSDLNVREKLLKIKDWMAINAPEKPIYIGEIGWTTSTDHMGISEELQAAYLAQLYIVGLSVEAKKIIWYKPTSSRDPVWSEMQYGYYRWGGTPKPSALAFSQAAKRLKGASFEKEIILSKQIRCYLFRTKTHAVAAIYTPGTSDVKIVFKDSKLIAEAFDGYPIDITKQIDLGELPIYVMTPIDKSANLEKAINSAEITGLKNNIIASATVKNSNYIVEIINQTREDMSVSFSVEDNNKLFGLPNNSFTKDLNLAPFAKRKIPFNINNIDREVKTDVNLKLDDKTFSLPIWIVPLERVKIDNVKNLSDTTYKRKPIKLTRADIRPADMQHAWKGEKDLSGELNWGWSDKGIHIDLKVLDDKHVPANDTKSLWKGDSIQLGIDVSDNRPDPTKTTELGFYVNKKNKAGMWNYSGKQPDDNMIIYNVSRNNETSETYYNILIKWEFLENFHPEIGKSFYMSLMINENDGSGRKSTMGLSEGVGGENFPHLYPCLIIK